MDIDVTAARPAAFGSPTRVRSYYLLARAGTSLVRGTSYPVMRSLIDGLAAACC